jgi:hypothetical protein
MALPAIECVRRGALSLRANWELVVVQWLATLALVALVLLGLVPPLLAVGVGSLGALASGARDWWRWLPDLAGRLEVVAVPLLAALVGTLAVWLLAFLIHCWVQAGTYGVLVAADRQAPAGPGGDWRWFRTWSGRDFAGWAGRYLWRFFWFLNLYAALASLLLLLFVLLMAGAVAGGQRWGWPAALGIGCGGTLPLLFLGVVLGLWMSLAQADLAREGSGVALATRRGLRVLGRRLGGVLLVWLLFVAASTALAMVFTPFSLGADLLLRDAPAVSLAVGLAVAAVQALASSALTIALAAGLVALMRDDGATEAGA